MLSYGAHLVSVRVPDVEHPGESVRITRGPTEYAGFQTIDGRYMGATIGRFANRIAGAAFELDGVCHELESNEAPNHLHGGRNGFHHRLWQAEMIDDGLGVRCRLVSADGEGGYPGTVNAATTYRLGDRRLVIEHTATTDAPTVINLTNHAYWNLGGPEATTIAEHRLRVGFDRVLLTDDHGIPQLGPPVATAGTQFDLGGGETLASVLASGGLDHCYTANETSDDPVVVLDHPPTGRRLSITTNQLGLQVYTGNHLVPPYQAIAFEPQGWPNSPNRPDFPSSVLRPGQTYSSRSTYRFDW